MGQDKRSKAALRADLLRPVIRIRPGPICDHAQILPDPRRFQQIIIRIQEHGPSGLHPVLNVKLFLENTLAGAQIFDVRHADIRKHRRIHGREPRDHLHLARLAHAELQHADLIVPPDLGDGDGNAYLAVMVGRGLKGAEGRRKRGRRHFTRRRLAHAARDPNQRDTKPPPDVRADRLQRRLCILNPYKRPRKALWRRLMP